MTHIFIDIDNFTAFNYSNSFELGNQILEDIFKYLLDSKLLVKDITRNSDEFKITSKVEEDICLKSTLATCLNHLTSTHSITFSCVIFDANSTKEINFRSTEILVGLMEAKEVIGNSIIRI